MKTYFALHEYNKYLINDKNIIKSFNSYHIVE